MDKQENNDKQVVIINNIDLPTKEASASRTIGLIGDIDEAKSEEIIASLLYMVDTGKLSVIENPDDPASPTLTAYKPIDMYISTNGGSVLDMFAMYDLMNHIKTSFQINTIGLGKVMSAGVLILSSGSKGHRKIGKNCRVMIHNVMAGYHGSLSSIENEIEEVKWLQDRYIECLQQNTKLTKRRIQKLLSKQMDVYISAEQAIEYGIADEII